MPHVITFRHWRHHSHQPPHTPSTTPHILPQTTSHSPHPPPHLLHAGGLGGAEDATDIVPVPLPLSPQVSHCQFEWMRCSMRCSTSTRWTSAFTSSRAGGGIHRADVVEDEDERMCDAPERLFRLRARGIGVAKKVCQHRPVLALQEGHLHDNGEGCGRGVGENCGRLEGIRLRPTRERHLGGGAAGSLLERLLLVADSVWARVHEGQVGPSRRLCAPPLPLVILRTIAMRALVPVRHHRVD